MYLYPSPGHHDHAAKLTDLTSHRVSHCRSKVQGFFPSLRHLVRNPCGALIFSRHPTLKICAVCFLLPLALSHPFLGKFALIPSLLVDTVLLPARAIIGTRSPLLDDPFGKSFRNPSSSRKIDGFRQTMF